MAGRSRTSAIVAAVAVTGISVLAVLLGFWLFARFDLTGNSRYSLSQVSRDAVRALDGLEVQVYISRELPVAMLYDGREIDIRGFDRELLDRLSEYRSWSGGRMHIKVIRDEVETRAAAARLELFSYKDAEVRGGTLQFRKYALGAVFQYRNQVEVLPIVTDPESLEFEITKRLSRLKEGYARSLSIQPYLLAGQDILAAASACNGKLDSYRTDKSQNAGLEVLTGSGDGLKDSLIADLPAFSKTCGGVSVALAAAAHLAGSNELMDLVLRSARLYEDAIDRLVAAMSNGAGVDDADLAGMVQRLESVFRVLDSDAMNLINLPGSRTVAFMCGHREFCPFEDSTRLVEPQIATALARTGAEAADFLAGVEKLRGRINFVNNSLRFKMFQNRGINAIPVGPGREIPDSADALVIFGPAVPIPESDRYRIDQFLLSGKSVIVFVNAWDVALWNIDENVGLSGSAAKPDSHIESRASNLSALLGPYGVRVRGDLVVGLKSYSRLRVAQPGQGQQVDKWFQYPLLPFLTEMDRTHVLVRSMPGVVLPWATTLEVDASLASSDKLRFSELILTNRDNAVAGGGLDVMPDRLVAQLSSMKPATPAPVAVAVTGLFKSAFEREPAGAGRPGRDHLDSGQGRLLVVGSSMGLENLSMDGVFDGFSLARMTEGKLDPAVDFARYSARYFNWEIGYSQVSSVVESNMDFIYNCLDWGVQNDDLAEIRSKSVDSRPVAAITPFMRMAWQIGLVAVLPLAFALFGLIRWRIRRRGA